MSAEHRDNHEHRIDRLLHGAIDLHRHGFPEISFAVRTRLEDVEDLTRCRQAGMRAVVLKSHMWPTVGRAYHLRQRVPGIEVFGSITLNLSVGGFSPVCVEAAARQGAKVLFMPTWSARHDIERNGVSRYMRGYLDSLRDLAPEAGLTILDGDGGIRGEVKETLALARDYGLCVCTGHLAPRESIRLAEECLRLGISSVLFSHPDSHSVGATVEEIVEMVRLGACIELCALGTLPLFQRIHPRQMLEIVAKVGAEHCVLTTDFFFEWVPPSAEMLRILVGVFLDLGLSEAEIAKMVQTTPARLLGLNFSVPA